MTGAKPFPYCTGKAGRWEPYESRGSRTVLGARGGEIPPRDSMVRSLIGGAILWAGWATNLDLLHMPCIVYPARRAGLAATRCCPSKAPPHRIMLACGSRTGSGKVVS